MSCDSSQAIISPRGSLLLEAGELLVTLRAVDDVLVIASLLDNTRLDELAHEVQGLSTSLLVHLQGLDLLP